MRGLFSIDSPFWETTDKAVRFLWLSILWAVCSVPVITAGASTAALYAVTLKYVRDEEGYLTSSFFRAFRDNFRQATAVWMIMLAVGAFLFMDFAVYYRGEFDSMVSVLLFTLFMGVFITFIFANFYVYPLLAYFDNTTKQIMMNAVMMAVFHLPSSIAMMTFSFAVAAIGMVFFPPLLFVAPGLTAYVNSRFLRTIFEQYQNAAEAYPV